MKNAQVPPCAATLRNCDTQAHAAAPAAPEAGFYSGTAVWAWVSQFLNVAAQGGTWAFFINYGVEKVPTKRPVIIRTMNREK